MSKEILENIINNFDIEKFTQFFRSKNNFFVPSDEIRTLPDDKKENFENERIIGNIDFKDGKLIICGFKVKKELSERSSRKAQYELGKFILKSQNKDAGIFIFYDSKGDFRFSLIFIDYYGKRKEFSFYKRFTYFVSKNQTNNTFLQQIGNGDFVSIEKIKELFSIEPITKEFYKEIQTWFFSALDKIYFPDNKDENKPLHLIRLLSRLIFVWFIKQKGLIPDKIFDPKEITKIVKEFYTSEKSCNYYNAILQNLFFATLNQPIKDRGWALNRGYPANKITHGIKQLYRYEDKFLISPEEILEMFSQIPFINGGLFDCLDKDDFGGEVIDGFSREEKRQAKIPDYLFFSEEIKTDLSKYQIKSNQKARGLINILKSYNFTIDEATPTDQEVALDPELLGKIFENLLAAYNPETATTARKATGSYYTPREIVEYMVHQSLLEYFKTKLPEIPEEKLDLLLSYSDKEIELEEKQKEKIIEIISEIKIIDPACGSGAFPMGILNKLVYVLGKIDPDNKYWKSIQQEKLKKPEKDKEERLKTIEDELEETFNENLFYPDYARKLYLIENCIFGVDIQVIATQLSKLRFFISLIIDQKVDKNKENFGIIPLPNLDLKFITANSLVGLELGKNIQKTLFENKDIKELSEKLKEKYHSYFRAKLREEKKEIRKEIEQTRGKLSERLKSTIKLEKEKELEKLFLEFTKIKNEIEKIKLEPEQFQIIEQKELFGGISQLRIDLKQEKIKNELKKLKEVNKKIEEIKKIISGDTLNQVAQKILVFNPFDPNYSNPWFEPEWTFGVNDGFDIVIANPPYIQLQNAFDREKKYADLYKDEGYETFDRMGDIYCLFYEKGMQLLKLNGILTYISSNKWMRARYGRSLRKFLRDKTTINVIIDFNGYKVFPEATVDTNILIVSKEEPKRTEQETIDDEVKFEFLNVNEDEFVDSYKRNIIEYFSEKKGIMQQNRLSYDTFVLGEYKVLALKEKIEKIGKPLKDWDVKIYFGILNGFNAAFIINTKKKDEILANCKTEDERKRTEEIIKPILRGRDIGKYYYKWADLWLIKIESGWTNKNRGKEKPEEFFKKMYPSVYEHLMSFSGIKGKGKGLFDRDNQGDYWWELRDCDYYSELEKEKIVWQEIVREPTFAFDDSGMYCEATTFLMTGSNLKYIIGLLNSNSVAFFFKKYYSGGGLGGEGFRYKKAFLERLPIPSITDQNQPLVSNIESLVDEILAITRQKNYNPDSSTEETKKVKELESQIDELVYQLYNLTKDEIKIIEGEK